MYVCVCVCVKREERMKRRILIGNQWKAIILMIKKSDDFISYPDSAQLPGWFAITDGLIYFRRPRTDPAEKGAEQGRMV